MEFWQQFEGQLLDGQFKLNKYLGLDGACAIYLSELPGQDRFVAVKIVRSASLQAQRLFSSWKHAKELQHPNLVSVYATAAADLDGFRIIYAVTDFPDATLKSVIQERCLTEEEGREFLLNCAEALQYLHQKGFIHTYVRPDSIVAVDVTTKLSSDFLCRPAEQRKGSVQPDRYDAQEAQKHGYSHATDVWSCGVTLFEALKQRLPAANTDPEIMALPGTFPEILRRCLDPNPASRWTARQILSFLQRSSSAPGVIGVTSEPAPVAKPVTRTSSPVAVQSTVTASSEEAPDSPLRRSSPLSPSLLGRWGLALKHSILLRYALSAVVVLICLGWLTRTSGQPHRPVPGTAGQDNGGSSSHLVGTSGETDRQVTVAAAHQVAVRPRPVGAKEELQPQRTPNSSLATASHSVNPPRSTWRVVLYAYRSAQIAQVKAADINAKSPQLEAQALSLGDHPSHVVVVGGRMGRDEAEKLRSRLIAEGFPRDIYIQNFSDLP